ncbi:MAG: PAS domain S-box protein [Chloroflexi bacterium]|nr:PAS domain S-box protein [Chloroflexota bacterium]
MMADRKTTEQLPGELAELREGAARCVMFIQQMPVPAFIKDATGRFLYVNRQFEQLLGTDWVGKTAFDLLPAELAAGMHADDQAALANGRQTREETLSDRHGVTHVFETTRFTIERAAAVADGQLPLLLAGFAVDITARKLAEEVVRDSETKYHAFFEAELDAVFLIEQATGQIIDANQSAERQYGYAVTELLALTIAELSAEPDVTRGDLQHSRVYTPLRYQRRRDGSVFPAEVTARSLVWQNRSVAMVAVRDIAERQRAEDALKQRNRELAMLNRAAQALTSTLNLSEVLELVLDELRRLLDVSASSIWLIDPATQQLVCRQATGPRAEAVRGWRISVDQGIVGWTAKTDQSVIITDAQTDERHFPGVDGSTGLPMRAIVSVPLRVQHQVIGVIQAVDELPARFDASSLRLIELLANSAAIAIENARLYEEIHRYAAELEAHVAERTTELQAERNRLQTVFDSAGEGIQILDRNFVVTYCNPATELIAGYSTAEVTGRPSPLFQPASAALTPEAVPADLRPTVERGEVWRGELVSRRKDGTAFDLAVTLSPLYDSDGQLSGYVAVHRDITRLKELDRLRDQFVSRIGHELRTPVANVMMHLSLLENGRVEERAQYLTTLQREADRLRRLVEGFLKIAELDANRVGAELKATDLNVVAGSVVRDHWSRAAQRQQQLEFEPEINLPLAWIDAELVQDVIRRLLDNALNYTPCQGSIECSTRSVVEANETWLTVSVKDDGPGLTADDLPRLFERFYRGHAARDYTVPGVGLSLAICRETIAKLGGRITVDSQPATEGRGATLTIWLRPAA